MSWLFYIIASLNLFTFTNLFDKFVCSKKFKSVYSLAVTLNTIYIVFFSITAFILRKTFVFNQYFWWAALAGILYFFMWILWWKALTTGEVSRSVAIFSTQPIFNALFASLILKEIVTQDLWIAIIFIVTGGILSSWEKTSKKGVNMAYIYTILATVIAAFGNVLTKMAVEGMPALTANSVGYFFTLPIYFLLLTNKKTRLEVKNVFKDKKSFGQMFIRASIGFVAISCFQLAIAGGPISLVSAINGVSPLVTLLYSTLISIFLPKIIKEETTKKVLISKILAFSLIVIGILIISF